MESFRQLLSPPFRNGRSSTKWTFVLLTCVSVGVGILVALGNQVPASERHEFYEQHWGPQFEVPLDLVTRVGLVVLVGLGILVILRLGFAQIYRRFRRPIWVLLLLFSTALCLVSATQYTFSRQHYFDAGDNFHYYLGAKYFDELGYEDFYVCAGHVLKGAHIGLPRRARDLSTNKKVPMRKLMGKRSLERCRNNFGEQRWEEFEKDVLAFASWHSRSRLRHRFNDHGYNGTPAWTVLSRAIADRVAVTEANQNALALANLAFVTVALGSLIWAFGWQVGLFATCLYWANFPDRYLHGGAWMRCLWLLFFMGSLAAMKKRRYLESGALMGSAASLLVFPVLFLSGIGAKLLYDLGLRRRPQREHLQFLGGAALSMSVFFFASLTLRQGLGAWTGFLHQMHINSGRLANGRIGFIYNFIWPKEWTGEQMSYLPRIDALHESLFLGISLNSWRWVLAVALLLVCVRAARKLSDIDSTILLGFAAFFLLFSTVRYYYAGLLGLPLLFASRRAYFPWLFSLILLQVVAYTSSNHLAYAFVYNSALSGGLTLCLLFALGLIELPLKTIAQRSPSATTKPSADGDSVEARFDGARSNPS